MECLWGIDLGGTKIEGIVIDKNTHLTCARLRVPTESHLGYDHVLDQITNLINQLIEITGTKPNKIGMGTPGTYDPIQKVMKNCNATALNGKNMQNDLQLKTGYTFTLSNDANCFAIAETKMGVIAEKMPNASVVFGVILGTGVGGGVVVNGQIISGRQGIGGEWGHNFLDDSGDFCFCGKKCCVETILAGPSLEKYYRNISGQAMSLPNIVNAYRNENDPYATATMERLYHYFGKAISVVINILDPDAVVIGGGVGNIDEIYTFGVEEVKKHIFNHQLDTHFYRPKLGDSAGVFGAAFL